jgi:hypothetical protein
MRFFLLDTLGDTNDEDLCFLGDFVKGIEGDSWRVHDGEPLGPIYPKDAKLFMSREYKGMKLCSLIGNERGMLLVSSEFKDLIQKHCKGSEIEILPFTLYDHRKRVLSKDYFLINPLGTFDCLDFKESDITWDEDEPGEVVRIRDYVVDKKKAKKAPQLFRFHKDSSTYVVGVELAEDMYERDLTNVAWKRLRFSGEPREEDE